MDTPPTADPISGSTPPPPPPYGRAPRQLRRRPDEGPIAGVCAGVAEYFNVDPVIVRIAAVVLLFTGPGAIAYILAWIFVPAAEGPYSHPFTARPSDRHDRGAQIFGIVLLAVSVSILWGGWWSPARRWFFPLGLMALGAWLLLRRDPEDDDDPVVPPSDQRPSPWAAQSVAATTTTAITPSDVTTADDTVDASTTDGPTADDDTTLLEGSPDDTLVGDADADPTTLDQPTTAAGASSGSGGVRPPWAHVPWGAGAWGHGPPVEVPESVKAARRRRRMVFPIVVGALLLWTGVAFLAGVSPKSGLAIALCIVGIGFVLGAFVGGSKALIVPAVVLGAALVVTSAVDVPLSGPVGDRTWTPDTIAEVDDLYELSVGEGVLDLTELTLGADDRIEVAATIGVGHLVIHVPDDAALEIDAEASGGDVVVLGQSNSGLGVSVDRSLGGDGSNGTIVLDLEVGFGQIEVIAMPSRRAVSTTTTSTVLG